MRGRANGAWILLLAAPACAAVAGLDSDWQPGLDDEQGAGGDDASTADGAVDGPAAPADGGGPDVLATGDAPASSDARDANNPLLGKRCAQVSPDADVFCDDFDTDALAAWAQDPPIHGSIGLVTDLATSQPASVKTTASPTTTEAASTFLQHSIPSMPNIAKGELSFDL